MPTELGQDLRNGHLRRAQVLLGLATANLNNRATPRARSGIRGMQKRTIAAFALAPLVPPLIYWAFGPSPDLDSLVSTVLVGAFQVTYPFTIGIGLPAFLLVTRHGRLRLWHVLAISAATGAVAGVLFEWTPLAGGAFGSSAGLTFWLIWYRRSYA